jgi:hypothetical protein
LRATIEIAFWRHGWAWPLAAITALSAVAAYVTVLRPGQQLQRTAEIELEQEQARPASPAKGSEEQPQDGQQRLQALQAVLRPSADTGELVRKMAVLAQAQQINLAQSDYQQQANAAIGVTRVQISQPVRASYPQLRRYIEAVLLAIPNASLDQVVARRDNVGQAQVEARLKWSLWIYKAPAIVTAASRKEGLP